jgi:L-fucose mutarotase
MLTVLEAILTVLPLDSDAPHAAFRAAPGNDPAQTSDLHQRIDTLCTRRGAAPVALGAPMLYDRIRAAHTIVATSESALFANVILRKGVVGPD